ncbi:dihydrofolate reductase [Nocardioides montaniterrae]
MTTPAGRTVTMVAAVAENGVIGNGPDIPWHVPGEQKVFKEHTIGTVLVLGRTTHESIGRPLPGRTTIVLSRDPSWSSEGVHVASSLPAALELADELLADQPLETPVTIGGGAAVYTSALPYADRQVISEIPLSPEGDVVYPAFDREKWRAASRDPRDGFTIVTWERVFACG